MRVSDQLRRANVGRRTGVYWRSNFGEAAQAGGDISLGPPAQARAVFAGGESFSGCRTSAKPSRPEVTFSWDRQLRQGPPSPAENASACERAAPRRTACVPATNSGERMLAGGESLSGGRTSAKPSRPEVTVYRDLHLRRELPSSDQVKSLE